MVDTEKTVLEAARKSHNDIKLNSRRRDIDTPYIIALNELSKLYLYSIDNFYDQVIIDSIAIQIGAISKQSNNIQVYSKPDNYPFAGYVIVTDDGYYLTTEDSFTLKID